jgi:hypothetical protein
MPTDPIAAAASVAPLNPSDPYLRRAQTSPALTDEQRERAADFGAVEALRRGTVLAEQ